MPRRKQRTRNRRLSDSIVAQLRQSICAGVPWVHVGFDVIGRLDLLALIKGCHFAGLCHFWTDENDEETPRFLWDELQDEIMEQHVKRRPGTRPHCWWLFDAPEDLRVVRIDPEYIACDEGRIYETEHEYLTRLDLLTDHEKRIFEKYGGIRQHLCIQIKVDLFGLVSRRLPATVTLTEHSRTDASENDAAKRASRDAGNFIER